MNRRNEMAAMRDILDAQVLTAQTKVAIIRRQEHDLRQQIARLREQRFDRPVADDPATRAAADVRWQGWIDTRLTALNTELAQIMVQKDREIAVLRRAFGRQQAMRALQDKAEKEARDQAMRRQTYVS